MKKVHINLGENSYDILIEKDIFTAMLDLIPKAEKYCLITDSTVDAIYGTMMTRNLESRDYKYHKIVIEPGEQSKSYENAAKIAREMVVNQFPRDSLIINFGGGVVSDLGAFVASVYKRGIPFINVPTTLLSQADASIGGKTGVNVPEGKNLIGTFYQPKAVFVGIEFLYTLEDRKFKTGLSEIVKYGMIKDKGLFELLEKEDPKTNLLEIVYRGAQNKADLVELDEKEANIRKICNFGHTIGHAFESIGNYETYTHGEGVAIGMVYEARLAEKLGYITASELERFLGLIDKTGILPEVKKFDKEKLLDLMKSDKKNIGGKIHFVIPTGTGECNLEKENYSIAIEEDMIRDVLTE